MRLILSETPTGSFSPNFTSFSFSPLKFQHFKTCRNYVYRMNFEHITKFPEYFKINSKRFRKVSSIAVEVWCTFKTDVQSILLRLSLCWPCDSNLLDNFFPMASVLRHLYDVLLCSGVCFLAVSSMRWWCTSSSYSRHFTGDDSLLQIFPLHPGNMAEVSEHSIFA